MSLAADPIDVLRSRTSEKWDEQPDDVIPMFVAEMDYPLAAPIRTALHAAIDRGDTGYVSEHNRLPEAFRAFTARRWGWNAGDAAIVSTADVSMGIVEILRQVTAPGDRVVITPPVYPPFFDLAPEAGASVVEVPLVADEGHRLDLAGLDAAFSSGARAFLLCNPHNPLGRPHSREELISVAELAARHGVTVISDEIHAPLTLPGSTFTPYLDSSPLARENGFAVHSASKAWNIAGLKCAIMVATGEHPRGALERMPQEVAWRTGQFGVIASTAAYRDGEPWLDSALEAIAANIVLLRRLLDEHLPGVSFEPPAAGYLAWLDFRALGWGDDPAEHIRREAKVSLSRGLDFGAQGAGFARMNLACSPELLEEAVLRIAALAQG